MGALNDEARTVVAATPGLREQTGGESPDSAPAGADGKEFLRLRALLALTGHCAYLIDPAAGSGGFLVARGGWLREVADLAALREFVERIGGGT